MGEAANNELKRIVGPLAFARTGRSQELRLSDSVLPDGNCYLVPKSVAKNLVHHKTERALILTNPRGRILFIDRTARRWLRKIFGRTTQASYLPPKLCKWLATAGGNALALSDAGKRRRPRLWVKRKALTNKTVVLALELVTGIAANEHRRRQRDLTAREQEVLFWLARGKSNGDIAVILGVAPATIGKHLERIYPKLGVENRTAASMFSQPETD
jgi:DNA-binding CsgD family transcriptional regulator